jgi:site-specific DNA recombinase
MLRAIGYRRVSLEEMALKGSSLEAQTSAIEKYASDHKMSLLEVIGDPGRSGKNLNRPGVQRVLQYVKARRIDTLIVYRQDRLTRRVSDALEISSYLTRYGVRLHTVCNQEVEVDSADGEFRFGLQALLDQYERQKVSERTKHVLKEKAHKGERVSGEAPYGYHFEGERVVICEQEQTHIRTIQNLSDEGFSVRQIPIKLAQQQILNRRGRVFGKTQIHTVLKKINRKILKDSDTQQQYQNDSDLI